jgi:cytochrome bd-type quinol oxidase subunit 1
MMVALMVVGLVTIFGVLIIGVIETRRMEKGQPSIISSISKKKSGEAEKES